ncbi:MAG: hypothetical protein UT41_C0004G0003 [Candidatus Wolfebacteria bacterium GW2011_GWC2_39_22]|uniref:HD domain-containing protein n=1 Tax=Candidatus Wolfebacteria bacterium GW2011_GWC2_39_22 TaxID=1619013 RepID=A0A0G0NGT3_9BACT|nr:MAG: hypothetical protein UT41_C0004G0003 [Candidatus Wolfebacteria bacterium GW2011_GWC2_39_22]
MSIEQPDIFNNTKERSTEQTRKAAYFNSLAFKYLPEMRLLLKGGKLVRKDENGKVMEQDDRRRWINVSEHCLVVTAEAEALAQAIGLTPEETLSLGKAAAIHDWDKRIHKKPQEFTEDDLIETERLLANTNVDHEVLSGTAHNFVKIFLVDEQPTTLLQRLLYYLDTITEENDIMPFKPRLAEGKKRAPKLGEDMELNNQIADKIGEGKGFWEGAEEISDRVQNEIFNLLKQKGFQLESPDEVPEFIKNQIQKNYK